MPVDMRNSINCLPLPVAGVTGETENKAFLLS